MADILHDFIIRESVEKVFEGISTPAGLNAWWTKKSAGEAAIGTEYELFFGPKYDWRAVVSKCSPGKEFELKMTKSESDWRDTLIGFNLEKMDDNVTQVHFYHKNWPATNDHFRISSYCWAMYLRILKRHLEFGEEVEYDKRLEV
jgi:uncharacterized protein YndB with AHSA1/START domain